MPDATAIVARFYDEVVSGGRFEVVDELCVPDFIEHGAPPDMPPGREGFKAFLRMLRNAFPDLKWTVDDWIATDEKVVARGSGRGTHRGDFLGFAPTGRPVTWSAIHIFRVVDGRLVERWSEADRLGLFDQLKGT